jgi:hypothetical protein
MPSIAHLEFNDPTALELEGANSNPLRLEGLDKTFDGLVAPK